MTGFGYGPIAAALDGRGDLTVLRRAYDPSTHAELPGADFGLAGKPLAPLVLPGVYFTTVASDTAGRTAIAGYLQQGPLGPGLYVSRREASAESFGPPVLLSGGSPDQGPQLAYDANGDLTVAWLQGNDLGVAVAAPGQPLRVTDEIRVAGTEQVSDERLAVDAAGEAVLAWAAGPHETRAACLPMACRVHRHRCTRLFAARPFSPSRRRSC